MAKTEATAAAAERRKACTEEGTAHFWDIDAHNHGVCRRCGEQRDWLRAADMKPSWPISNSKGGLAKKRGRPIKLGPKSEVRYSS